MKSRGGLTYGRGVTEFERNLWICSIHHYAGIHITIGDLASQLDRTSEQYFELNGRRVRRDNADLQKHLILLVLVDHPYEITRLE